MELMKNVKLKSRHLGLLMNQNSEINNILAGEGENGALMAMANSPKPQAMDTIQEQQQQNVNYNGIQIQQQQTTNESKSVRKKAYVKILEQPAGKALRFRYECEGRSAGSIPGVNSTSENKTYPTIEIVGYKGRAVVVVSCVTKDQPYRPHPHNLVGKEGCKKGVCTLEINPETMRAVFSNLGIQCVKKKDIESALKAREEIRVDPFKTGFTHRFHPSGIDLNSVRLCFQVFTESDQKGRFTQPLPPVVSEPIYDKKAMCDLIICRLCSCSATVLGNTQIILLCEKVAKEDISVRLFEEKNGQTIWEAYGEFQHTDVHKQTAITFRTPRYRKIDITEPAKVLIQLKRPSDGVTSEALPFEYVPLDSDPAHLKRKRQRTNGDPAHLLLDLEQNQHQTDHQDGRKAKANSWNITNIPAIKTEPRESSPQPFGIYRAPSELTPSPQPLSPSAYSHNTPSPYHMAPAVPTRAQTRQPVISSNQQYTATGACGTNNASTPLDINNYNNFSQQAQQQQHYHGSSFGGTDAHWEPKYNPTTGNNSSNLQNNNTFTLHNIFAPPNVAGAPGSATGPSGASWNPISNHFQPHHLQQQYLPHVGGAATNNNSSIANTAGAIPNANHIEHGLSNLLTIDSEQYVRINSEDQQMLQLNSEDLQISNLSIST